MLQNCIGGGAARTRMKIAVVLQHKCLRVFRKREGVAFGEEGIVPAELLQFAIRERKPDVQLQIVQVLFVVIIAKHSVLGKRIVLGDWRRIRGQLGSCEGT